MYNLLSKKRKGKNLKEDRLKAQNGNTIPTSLSIATAENRLMGRWWCAKTPTAKDNGSIWTVSTRKNCHKNGIARYAGQKYKTIVERLNKFYLIVKMLLMFDYFRTRFYINCCKTIGWNFFDGVVCEEFKKVS